MSDTAVRTRTRSRPAADAAEQAANSTALTQQTRPSGTLARQPREQPSQPAPRTDDTSWMHTGDAGAAAAERARQERAARDAENADKPLMPRRMKLDWKGNNGMGESADAIILDVQTGPRFWEHKTRNPRTGYWTEHEQCPHEFDNCPLCPPIGERQPYYVMMLTVIDLRPYERDGQTIAASRKLLPVKLDQQAFFDDLFKQHGTLRGAHLILTRDGGKTSPEIGNTIHFDSFHSEEELEEFAKQNGFWEARYTDNGRLIYGEGEFIQPFKYGMIFERPSGAKLREKYGINDGGSIGGAHEQRGEGWRNGTDPGRAPGGLQRQGSSRRVNLDDGPSEPDDHVPF